MQILTGNNIIVKGVNCLFGYPFSMGWITVSKWVRVIGPVGPFVEMGPDMSVVHACVAKGPNLIYVSQVTTNKTLLTNKQLLFSIYHKS